MGGYPVVAMPCRMRPARLNSVAQIHGFTPKRWVFKQVLRAAILTGADRFFTTPCADPLQEYAGIATTRFLSKINSTVSNRATTASVIWPWPPNRYRGRIYIQIFDQSGAPVGFAKIALEPDQAAKIEGEGEMLRTLGTSAEGSMRVPALLASGEVDGKTFILCEPLPVGLKAIGPRFPVPEQLFEELASEKKRLLLPELASLPWWTQFQSCLRDVGEAGRQALEEIEKRGLAVCRVHGDFSSKNIFRDLNGFWIVDWETGSISAPHLVDRVCYQLETLIYACESNPSGALHVLIGKFGTDLSSRLDLVAALGYLMIKGSREAERLLACWPNFSEVLNRG